METERLILRKARIADAEALAKIRNSGYVLRYNPMKVAGEVGIMRQICEDAVSENVFYLELKGTGDLVGLVCLEEDSLRHGVESWVLAYYLGEEFSGRGLMTEALRETLRHCFEDKKAETVSARVFKGNIASETVLKKLGFTLDGVIRHAVRGADGQVYDDMVFTMLKSEYENFNN